MKWKSRWKSVIGTKQTREVDERLDWLSRELVRASADNETEAEAASSPFLYARLRTRIAAERERRQTGENWLAWLSVAWRSAPAMTLVAGFALILFWSASLSAPAPSLSSDEALLNEQEAGIEQMVFADSSSPSSDEVLATIMYEDEGEASR